MNTLSKLFLTVILALASSVANAQQDPNLQPISRAELLSLIAKTPLTSPQHGRYISRARVSKLIPAAYVKYQQLQRAQPNSPYANYWLGLTAYTYDWQTGYKSSGIRVTPEQRTRIYAAAESGLRRAVELKPDYAAANSAYGGFLIANPYSQERGLELMRKAVQLEPKKAAYWRTLGEVLINPYFKYYDSKEGEEALLKAIKLDPLFTGAHSALLRLYVETKRFKEAQRELQIYTRLVGAKKAEPTIKFFQPRIDKVLKR